MSTVCKDGKPCPEPKPNRGKGASACEQNGLCQRLDFDNVPRLKVELLPEGGINLKVQEPPMDKPIDTPLSEVYEVARFVQIPSEAIDRFVGAMKLCGYEFAKTGQVAELESRVGVLTLDANRYRARRAEEYRQLRLQLKSGETTPEGPHHLSYDAHSDWLLTFHPSASLAESTHTERKEE
jgi:hypothetical protein